MRLGLYEEQRIVGRNRSSLWPFGSGGSPENESKWTLILT